MRELSNPFALDLRKRGAPPIITALVPPALGVLVDGDAIEDALSADIGQTSNYASTAGTISSVTVTATINGSPADLTDTVAYQDAVQIVVTVTDDLANVRVWTRSTTATALAPSAFTSGQWSLANDDVDVTLTVSALPADGGAPITDLQFRVNGGAWASLGGTTTGSYTITAVEGDDIEIRAVNAIGAGPASDVKAVPSAFTIEGLFTGETGIWHDNRDAGVLVRDTTVKTAPTVGQTVFIALDKSRGLERTANLFAGFPVGIGTWTNPSSGVWEIDGSQTGNQDLNGDASIAWSLDQLFDWNYTQSGAAFNSFALNSAAILPPVGNVAFFRPANSNLIRVRAAAGQAGSVSNFDVRRVLGNHSVQTSASFRPTRAATGLTGDGTDDRLLTTFAPTASGSLAVRINGATASRIALGSMAASDGRCFIGLNSSGQLAAGIGTQSLSTITDLETDRTNFFTFTEDFGNAAHGKTLLTASQVSGAVWKLAEAVTTSRKWLAVAMKAGYATAGSKMELEVKPDGRNFVSIGVTNSTGFWSVSQFNLSTGTFDNHYNAGASPLNTNPQITALADGWFRVSVEIGESLGPAIMISNGGNPIFEAYSGDGTSGLLIRFPNLAPTVSSPYQPIIGAALRDIRNEWHTGVVTWDGSTVKLYLDGVEVYSDAQSGAVNTTVAMSELALNTNGTFGSFWQGQISDSLALSRVLTPTEIANTHNLWSI